MKVSCAAVLCVRNEHLHIRRALTDFIDQGIDVVVIDHGSTDGTREICEELIGSGVLSIDHIKWEGVYDQTAQLKAKARVFENLRHDWIIHADADEWLQSSRKGESLLDGLDRINENGFNVVNFEEFVFLPYHGQQVDFDAYRKDILGYYLFAPHERRLMRAWKRSASLKNIDSGGHTLSGQEMKIAPESFILRHYIVLSHELAVQKYVRRTFSRRDLERGWHGNRLHLRAEDLELPPPDELKMLSRWDSKDFDRTEPRKIHYWGW
jgi:glycosyltransferase involved in cell wall biosynthesis